MKFVFFPLLLTYIFSLLSLANGAIDDGDDYPDWLTDDYDLPPPQSQEPFPPISPRIPQHRFPPPPPPPISPPSLSDGLCVTQGGVPVATVPYQSLVELGKPFVGQAAMIQPTADQVAKKAKDAFIKGGIIVIIPTDLMTTAVRLAIDGGAGVCRGSSCSGTGSTMMIESSGRLPLTGNNNTASVVYPARGLIPVSVSSAIKNSLF